MREVFRGSLSNNSSSKNVRLHWKNIERCFTEADRCMIRQLTAHERFSTCEVGFVTDRFSPNERPASDPSIYVPILYYCTCGYEISFSEADFATAARSSESTLQHDEAGEFDEAAARSKTIELPFLDFRCPHCQAASRVYFEILCGKATNFKILWVFEKRQ